MRPLKHHTKYWKTTVHLVLFRRLGAPQSPQEDFVENERKLIVIARPVRDCRRDIQEDLEPNLFPRKLSVTRPLSMFMMSISYLRDHICRLSEVRASAHTRLRQVIFNQSHTNIIAHLVQLFVDLLIVAVVILA